MKFTRWIGLAIVVLTAVLLAVYVQKRRPPAPVPSVAPQVTPPVATPVVTQPPVQQPAPRPSEATVPSKVTPPVAETPAEEHLQPSAEVTTPVLDHEHAVDAQLEGAVEVRASEVLATVNGSAITLADLVPVPKGQEIQAMSADDYARRLEFAIERSLVAQKARQEGVSLTQEQELSVDAVRQRHEADIEASRQQGLAWTSITPEQIEFEANRAAAILLKQNLLSKAGAPPLQPTQEMVEEHYRANQQTYGELPADPALRDATWQQIYLQIRQELDPKLLNEYLTWQVEYLNAMKSEANVVVN